MILGLDINQPSLAFVDKATLDNQFQDRSTKEMNQFVKQTAKPKIQVDKNELKKKLTPMEYHITQEKGTER